MSKQMWVYILASRSRCLYVGVTNNLYRRWLEHREGSRGSFTSRYQVKRLVYFEVAPSPTAAIAREKQLKRWRRAKKVALIESSNPGWRDLSRELGW